MALPDDYGRVETPRTFFRHELRLQSVFIKLARASNCRDHQPAVYFCRPPGVEAGTRASSGGIT